MQTVAMVKDNHILSNQITAEQRLKQTSAIAALRHSMGSHNYKLGSIVPEHVRTDI